MRLIYKYEVEIRKGNMVIEIDKNGIWYHGSNIRFEVLREGSTITQRMRRCKVWKKYKRLY